MSSPDNEWIASGPQPLHHVSASVPVADMPEAFRARVLYLSRPDGTVERFEPLLKYFIAFHTRSRSWQDTAAQGMGLLWDFSIATADRRPGRSARELFRDFARALALGTIADDGSDDRGLYWPATPYDRTRGLIKSIEHFAAWLDYEEGSTSPIAPDFVPLVPGTGAHASAMIRWSRQRHGSMLVHIAGAPRTAKKSATDLGREPRGRSVEPVKFFPPEHAASLLWKGYLIPGREQEPNIFLRYNVRNMMIALLDGWGGMRRSEAFHLWETDVEEDPGNPEHALVVISHPAEAKIVFRNPMTRREQTVTRRQYLQQKYGLPPRSDVKRGSYRAGWKGMDLDIHYRTCIFWIDTDAAALFWALYWGYLKYVRAPIMAERIRQGGGDHPFLFISTRADQNAVDPDDLNRWPGAPYSEAAYERAHQAAVERIGLDHGKDFGTSTHGLRHLYGKMLTDLGVPAQVIKKGLHHRNFLSQGPYTVPDNAKTNAKLVEAQQNIVDGKIRITAPIAPTTAEALLRIRDFIAGGPGGAY